MLISKFLKTGDLMPLLHNISFYVVMENTEKRSRKQITNVQRLTKFLQKIQVQVFMKRRT